MLSLKILLVSTILAALIPLLQQVNEYAPVPLRFPGFPTAMQGKPIEELPLTDKEQYFLKDFPGKVGRFTDGDREIIVRWIATQTRKLHPAEDCLRASGYTVTPEKVEVDSLKNYWGCMRATRAGSSLRVCERIYDESGNSWSDVSSWFWNAALGKTNGPWWAVTIGEAGQ